MTESTKSLVAIIMGSKSDWETMRHAAETLTQFGVPHECRIVSAHRTPDLLVEFAKSAETRGLEVIIAGAGGAAHLPGMTAAHTVLPVLGVPVESHALKGMDSLLSIVQMPGGIPVGTLAIGKAGATNAALLALAILGNSRPDMRGKTPSVSRRANRQGAQRQPELRALPHCSTSCQLVAVSAVTYWKERTRCAVRQAASLPLSSSFLDCANAHAATSGQFVEHLRARLAAAPVSQRDPP
jgi:5-(carboxyamino)imidazole ribonucleotide mutase